jgi:hypothetical protein
VLSCFRFYWEIHVWSVIHMEKTRQHDPLSMWITLHTWTSQYKWKQDNTILYPCESHFIHGLLNTSENKTTRSFIHVNHTSYVDLSIQAKTRQMDKGSCCLVFACIKKSTYEVWFTRIKDRIVLFSLVLRSPCMKQAKTRQYDPLSVWITLHTCTS